MSKPVVVVMYEYFFPGYKAGGPIQSLVNMITALQDRYEFKVVTTAYDLNETVPYNNVKVNQWNEVRLIAGSDAVSVWYAAPGKIPVSSMKQILTQARPDIIFINGLFTQWFAQPLWLYKLKRVKNVRIVVSPRGMLQPGALQVKPFKKKVYLGLFKLAGMFRNIHWHATSADEKTDIRRIIGEKATVAVAANIPRRPVPAIMYPEKTPGELRLVYLSIITEKKNLLLLLQLLQQQTQQISLSIYGPVKEEAYWQLCEQAIRQLPANITVNYGGNIEPDRVQQTLQQYHAFISLTKGENFGHALYESLSVGRPVITSYFTPWNELQQKQAGFNVDIHDSHSVSAALGEMLAMDKEKLGKQCEGAYQLAKDYYFGQNFKEEYTRLLADS